jgi:hypothetical protein
MFRRTMMASAIAVVTARVVAPIRHPQTFSRKALRREALRPLLA